jgi:GT2 family glycosyltransferase/Fe-S-cluster containining protein
MAKFVCDRNGECCKNTLVTINGQTVGLYLSPQEAALFPVTQLAPLRDGFQLTSNRCPHLQDGDGITSCAIYEQRPLICRSFPVTGLHTVSTACACSRNPEGFDADSLQAEITVFQSTLKPDSISIIIPTYHATMLPECLESLKRYTDLTDIEVIIVANGCTEETHAYLSTLPYRVLWFAEPLGFTRAVNEGIQVSSGKYVVLLNDDCVLLPQRKGWWLEWLKRPFTDSTVGITGSHQLFDYNSEQLFLLFYCVMIKREVFEQIGLLDEVFNPGAGEDTDYCIRARAAGYQVVFVDEDKGLVHDGEKHLIEGYFPLYHKAEQTVAQAPDWQQTFDRNGEILRRRYRTGEFTWSRIPRLEEQYVGTN